jgi:poly(hydroxyalkanoate) granule-associated protein
MTEQVQEIQEEKEELVISINTFFDAAHKTFLAGLGAASIAQDELKKGFENSGELITKLVERGEEISNERREQATAEAEKRQEQAKDLGQNVTDKVGETYNQMSTATLHRMNVPTSEDIQALSKQIAALDRKVDRVRKEQKELATA